MLKIVDLFIPGTPQGKGRARSFMRNGGISHVTPDKTRTYEGIIRTLAMEAMSAKPPSRMPVRIDLVIVIPIAESWPKWKRHAAKEGYLAPTAKPDSDNVEKAIKDALNGVVWVDDAQAVFGIKEKVFGEEPGVYVKAYALNRVPSGVKSKEEFSDYVKRLGLEAKNGPVKTMPIQQRQFTASGIPKIGADEAVKLESTERRAMSAIRGGCRTPAEIREKLVARGYVRKVSRGNYEPAIKPQFSSSTKRKGKTED